MMMVYKSVIAYYSDIHTMKLSGYDIETVNKMIPYEMTLYLCFDIEHRRKLKNAGKRTS